jgi:DNA-binding NarL/FixJ family response regulator
LKSIMQFNIHEAESGEDALIKVSRIPIDVALIDYQMPGITGAETIIRILRFKPKMKILALSNYDELSYIQSMMDAGAKGYVLKDIERPEMLKALKTIFSGELYYCSKVAIKLLDWNEAKNQKKMKVDALLTKRETEVLKLIAMEMTNDAIACKLFVSKRTIDAHRQNLLNKLHVKNSVGLVKAAYRLNLIEE